MTTQSMPTQWVRIDASGHAVLADLTSVDPAGRYHPSLQFVPVPAALAADPVALSVPLTLAADGVTLQVADPAVYAAAQKAAMQAAADQARSAGTTVNGVAVATDPTSLTLIAGAHALAQSGVQTSFAWQGETGWTTLTAAQVIALAQAVGVFVQGVFTRLQTVQAAIDAALAASTDPQAQVAAVRAAAVWPAG